MTKATKRKLDELQQKVNLANAAEDKEGSKLKLILIAVVGALVIVFFFVFKKRRK
jgi:hypothetical protein